MSKSTITKERANRIVTVHAVQTAKHLDSEEDADVAGVYQIEINKGVPKRIWAGVALDVFHTNVAVAMLDDFEFTVKDGRKVLTEPDDYESYSGEGKGDML